MEFLSGPQYERNELMETVGYVHRIWSEQEGNRAALHFVLAIWQHQIDEPIAYQHFSINTRPQ